MADLDAIYADLQSVEGLLWLLALATLTLDVYLTYLGLQAGFAEGNPILAPVIDVTGFAALGLVKVVVLGVAGFTRELKPRFGAAIALALVVPWLVAVVVNYSLLF